MNASQFFNRTASTLGIMDDLQVAVHTYDGCGRGCSGCLVDKHFKNTGRGALIINEVEQTFIHQQVTEYYHWCQEHLNQQESGYFGIGKNTVKHFSYTFRFGNHAELPDHLVQQLSQNMAAPFQVFSVAPFNNIDEELRKFIHLQQQGNSSIYLEIIYDPIVDDALQINQIISAMREHDILGYPEILITQRLLSIYGGEPHSAASIREAAARFVHEKLAPLQKNMVEGVQVQFGRYSPSKTRNFNTSQVVDLDHEIEWLAAVAEVIVQNNMNLHPIPIGEYAVTFFDEYQEKQAFCPSLGVDPLKLPPPEAFNLQNIIEYTRDIFKTSLYIDHNLDVFVWSESMGQHVLDSNFGFPALGNLKEHSLISIINNGKIDKMAIETARHFITNSKCKPCRYKSFCASHAIPFFRKWHDDKSSKHCYGYIPVIRQFQRSPQFLSNMVDGFKNLGF